MNVRYDCLRIETALADEYAVELKSCLKRMQGLNDLRDLTEEWERDFAAYIGVPEAVAVASGSDALRLILLSLGIGKGDEVILPSLTYHADPLAVAYGGARPVVADVQRETLSLDPEKARGAIGKKTRAVIAPHMFAIPCCMKELREICRRRSLFLVEDVCQAEGTSLDGRMLGSFGDLAAFSFSYYKPLSSCAGGGGMVCGAGERIETIRRWMKEHAVDAQRLKLGQRFAPPGLMDLVSLRVKLKKIGRIHAARRKLYEIYTQELSPLREMIIPSFPKGAQIVPQNFPVLTGPRDALFAFLSKNGITAQWPYTPVHQLEAFRAGKKMPVSELYAQRGLQLPLFSLMSEQEVLYVTGVIKVFFRR